MVGLNFAGLMENTVFTSAGIPALIFMARVCDVSIGTVRTAFIAQGIKGWAAILGFFEILIWLTAITYILQNLQSVPSYLAYAAGFGVGNYVGLIIEERMAKGLVAVTTIAKQDATPLINYLRQHDYGLTSVSATGTTGRVRLILSVLPRNQVNQLRSIIERFHPRAFIAVQPVRSVSKEIRRIPGFADELFETDSLRKSK